MATVLEVSGLRKRYKDVEALKGIDLRVESGEVFGFLGPNGAGKTTFTKCVTGFVRPDAGSVRIMGRDAVAAPHRVAAHVGLVPDQYDFYRNLTGRQHLDFYGRLAGMPNEERSARIEEVLERVRMTERADTRVSGYSHGMKQRICIGQAILHKPHLVILDEPTNGLDPKGAYELRLMIQDLARDGTTIFLISHLLLELEQVCERVAILDRGTLRTVASVRDLRRQAGGQRVEAELDAPTRAQYDALVGVGATDIKLEGTTASFVLAEERVPDAVAALVRSGGRVRRVETTEGSLESVFLRLTEPGTAEAAGAAGTPGSAETEVAA